MRLIDAHQIESKLNYAEFDRDEKVGWLEAYRHFMKMIEEAPTAYDVDKVVERIKNCDYCDSDGYLEPDAVVRIVKEEIKA